MKFFDKGRVVIFKQRINRHLAAHPDLDWEYQEGKVTTSDRGTETAIIHWLQDYNDRTDKVSFEDIVMVDDRRCKEFEIGSHKGHGRILQEIVPEGT